MKRWLYIVLSVCLLIVGTKTFAVEKSSISVEIAPKNELASQKLSIKSPQASVESLPKQLPSTTKVARIFDGYKQVELNIEPVTARTGTQSFKSFSAFKRALGSAGKGKAWHHIVEQNPANIAKFGAESIHTTGNLIKLPHGAGTIHARISGFYSSKQAFTGGQTVRQWLSAQSYQTQYDFGIKTLKQFGWTP